MKATCVNAPRVLITPEAKQRLDLYLGLCPDEISGLGRVSRLAGDFLIEEVILFSQEVTAGSTDLDPEAVSRFLLEAVQAGLDPANLKLWWHSHVNGGCFWSGTDEATAGRFGNGWMLSCVGNKRGEYKCRLDLYEPIRLTVDELDLQVYHAEDFALTATVRAEIAEKVKKRVYVPPAGYLENGGGHRTVAGFSWPDGGRYGDREEDFRQKKTAFERWEKEVIGE